MEACWDKNYKSSLKPVSIFNTKQFLETQTAGPGCATSSASLISLPFPSTPLLTGQSRVRKFILTECLFSFEYTQLISQKALFRLSPFAGKIRKKVGQKAEGGSRLTRLFEYTLNGSLSDEVSENKYADGDLRVWFGCRG